jgi:hypothetical protein
VEGGLIMTKLAEKCITFYADLRFITMGINLAAGTYSRPDECGMFIEFHLGAVMCSVGILDGLGTV